MIEDQARSWARVSRREPCPICGRPDWCGRNTDGRLVICMREESSRATANGGWLHELEDPLPVRRVLASVAPVRDFDRLAAQWQRNVTPTQLAAFADRLGLADEPLLRLGVGWVDDRRCWAFPMRSGGGRIVGIRLRDARTGRKFAERGSREGLFFDVESDCSEPLIVCEGPTDTTAALSLGFDALGRPSCTGGTKQVAVRTNGRDVVVVCDADGPGRRGGQALACAILPTSRSVRVIEPPNGAGDLREWVAAGATRADLLEVTRQAPVRRLGVRFSSDG